MGKVQPRVNSAMNESLSSPYTEDEIVQALNGIGDLKAPGPDGMPAIFFKKFWDTIGNQVKQEVMTVLNGDAIPDGWNETTVVLIPKVKDPQCLKDFRPISLCNVLYKIISKVIANRLKVFLDVIISPNQNAFVPRRLISDNVLVAYELTHYLQNKRRGKEGFLALKLDMSKAYDRVEWDFLEAMLSRLGFNQNLVDLLMNCVRSVKYRIKINGDYSEEIIPHRGLRQGDPLSPYLFLICAEGFSSLLQHAEENNMIQGIRICQGAPSVSHLLFADDSLILMKATEQNAMHLQQILRLYEECSGQKINKEKSAIMFSKNTMPPQRQQVRQALNLQAETANKRYLGLPVYISHSKCKAFEYIRDRIWNRIQGWKEKLLSKAGKEILIKAVAQAIPTYAMACFDLTKNFCDQVSSMICQYWWSQQDKDKMHWLSWDKLSHSKKDGGLGFRDLYAFNQSMLAKQGWRLIQAPDSLCAQVLKARYYPNGSVLTAQNITGMSYTWRSVLKGINLLKKGIIWRIGNGESVDIWNDPWLPRGTTRRPSTVQEQTMLRRVSELINPATTQWDEVLVRNVFNHEDAEVILSITLGSRSDDFVAWHFDPKGVFSVKSAYKVFVHSSSAQHGPSSGHTVHNPALGTAFPWTTIWAMGCPNKIKSFVWRLAHNSLPTLKKIRTRGMDIDTRCPCCCRLDEDGGHLFFKCKSAKSVWRDLLLEEERIVLAALQSPKEVLLQIWKWPEEKQLKIITILWVLWTERNSVNAGDKAQSPNRLSFQAQKLCTEFLEFFSKRADQPRSLNLKWQYPSEEFLKINIDAAFFEHDHSGGWGFVIRDHSGSVVGSGAGKLEHITDSMQAETNAALQALKYASEVGMLRVVLETDAFNLKSALVSSSFDSAPCGVIFRELRYMMITRFTDVRVSYCPRSCNRVAHKLASLGVRLQVGDVLVWHDTTPADVSALVAADVGL